MSEILGTKKNRVLVILYYCALNLSKFSLKDTRKEKNIIFLSLKKDRPSFTSEFHMRGVTVSRNCFPSLRTCIT